VPEIALTVFTKPWTKPLELLADKVAGLGLDGVELPIRPGYQVQPADVTKTLPAAVQILNGHGLEIRSVAAPLEPEIIRAGGKPPPNTFEEDKPEPEESSEDEEDEG